MKSNLPKYLAPKGVPEHAAELRQQLLALLNSIDGAESEIAELSQKKEELERRRGEEKPNPQDREAIVEAAADRLQLEAIEQRIRELHESSREERGLFKFLDCLPSFYGNALRGYHQQLLDYLTEMARPLFNNETEARRALEPVCPALENLNSFIFCDWRRVKSVTTARQQLHVLEKLSRGECPWKWQPLR